MTPASQRADVTATGAADGAPMAPAGRAAKARAAATAGAAPAAAPPAKREDDKGGSAPPAAGSTRAPAQVAVTHEPVKLARARAELLCDPGTFHTHRSAVGDGVIAGSGKVGGRAVYIWAQDGTFKGGSLGSASGETIVRTMEMA